MKVYIHLLMVGFFSVMVVGCTGDNTKIDYSINGWSGWTISITGSISLKESGVVAYINEFTGSVMLDNIAVIHGTVIHENSLLVTWSGWEAEIIFSDSSVVRLSPYSRLQISKMWTDNTTIDLQEWTLWARILKPFTDVSFFTLETDDLSAWVRGTSIWMMTDSGWTDIGIVDTTSTGWTTSWALIDIVDKAHFWSGSIHLTYEDVLRVRHMKPLEHKKMKLSEQIKMHPFVWVNTIRDIRYMERIIQDPTSQMGTRGRVHMEMDVTMPNSDEIMIFLTDPVIRSEIKKQTSSDITPSEFIRYLDIDKKIENIMNSKIPETDKKKAIEDTRKLILETILVPVESTGSTGSIVPLPQSVKTPVKVTPIPHRVTPATVSGEIKRTLCASGVSGEVCR